MSLHALGTDEWGGLTAKATCWHKGRGSLECLSLGSFTKRESRGTLMTSVVVAGRFGVWRAFCSFRAFLCPWTLVCQLLFLNSLLAVSIIFIFSCICSQRPQCMIGAQIRFLCYLNPLPLSLPHWCPDKIKLTFRNPLDRKRSDHKGN